MQTTDMQVEVPAELRAAIPLAVARAGYLFPSCVFKEQGNAIVVSGVLLTDQAAIRKQVLYALYREHIRKRFEPFRKQALNRLYGSTK